MAKYDCIVDSADQHECYEVTSASAMKAAEQYGRKEKWEMVSIVRKRTRELVSRVIFNEYGFWQRCYLGNKVRYYEFDK